MKRIITLFTVLLIFGASFVTKAQLTARGATTHVTGDPSGLLSSHVTIINNSGSAVVVKVRRVNTSLAAGHDSYFCWGATCYPPTTSLSPSPVTILPGDSSTTFIGYADPQGNTGLDTVNYTFYDTSNVNNKVVIDFTYDFATGINVLHSSTDFMNCSQSYTDDATNITYKISSFKNGKLLIRNLLGSVVKEVTLADRQGILTVSTSDLQAGIYMYFLYNNNEPVATKKMVISHR